MNPAITSPVPAQDEMGMDYIPVYADSEGGDHPVGTVTINPVVRQNLGVRTAQAQVGTIHTTVAAWGNVVPDENRLTRIHPRSEGWVQRLFVSETGEKVAPDAMLLAFYSPTQIASQEEYLLALRQEGATSPVTQAARRRLELLGVPPHQIKEIEAGGAPKTALHIHTPQGGQVLKIGVRPGGYVTPATTLYEIADLSRVWVEGAVYEDDIEQVKVGDLADIALPALPGQILHGTVAFIAPVVEAATRTAQVRVELDNRDLRLRPGMYAQLTLRTAPRQGVTVPLEAVVRSGKHDRVFIAAGEGRFEPREVTVGRIEDGRAEIFKGLKGGETVVTSAQFLIDSESSLREAVAKRMAPQVEQDAGDLDMGGMSLKGMTLPGGRP